MLSTIKKYENLVIELELNMFSRMCFVTFNPSLFCYFIHNAFVQYIQMYTVADPEFGHSLTMT